MRGDGRRENVSPRVKTNLNFRRDNTTRERSKNVWRNNFGAIRSANIFPFAKGRNEVLNAEFIRAGHVAFSLLAKYPARPATF